MGSTSEREYKEKLHKIQEKLHKRIEDDQKNAKKIEQIKVESLKKAEDLRRSADKEINKIEGNIIKSKDLAPESKERLRSEIVMLKNEIEGNYVQIRRQIAESIVPAVA
jgi:cob(I)alamin adenosyltransferase